MSLSKEQIEEWRHGSSKYPMIAAQFSALCDLAIAGLAAQAAAEDMRERAAKVCEERAMEYAADTIEALVIRGALGNTATAIRALPIKEEK